MENTTRIEGDQLVSERRIPLDSFIKAKEGEIMNLQETINMLVGEMNIKLNELRQLNKEN